MKSVVLVAIAGRRGEQNDVVEGLTEREGCREVFSQMGNGRASTLDFKQRLLRRLARQRR